MIKVPLKAGHHWPASEMPFKWRFAGVVALRFSRGSGPILPRKLFCDLSGGMYPMSPPPPSGSAHASQENFSHVGTFPGLNQYQIKYNVSCIRKQYGETQTNGPLSQVNHSTTGWLTLQVLYSYLVSVLPRGMRWPGLI